MNTFTLSKQRRAISCAIFLLALLLIGCGSGSEPKAAETHIEILERICRNFIAAEIYDGRQQCAIEIDVEADDTGFFENVQAMLTGGMEKADVLTAMEGFPVIEMTSDGLTETDTITWTMRGRSVAHWEEVMIISFRNNKLSRITLENR